MRYVMVNDEPHRCAVVLPVGYGKSKPAPRLLTNKKLRAALYRSTDGKCAICGEPLPDDWHADHVVPFTRSRTTNVHEMQPLCPACNLKKGDK